LKTVRPPLRTAAQGLLARPLTVDDLVTDVVATLQ